MGTLDEIFDLLNLTERADGLVGWLLNGPLHRFYVSRDSGWTGFMIESFLREYHIPIWDRGITSDTLYFSVKRKQAKWAEYLMKRRGIPLVSPPVNPKNDLYPLRHVPGSTPPRWDERRSRPTVCHKSWLDTFLSLFDGK